MTYEQAVFAWAADWQPDVRVLEPAQAPEEWPECPGIHDS